MNELDKRSVCVCVCVHVCASLYQKEMRCHAIQVDVLTHYTLKWNIKFKTN